MNLTIQLLRAIGSPFVTRETVSIGQGEISALYQHSIKNRMVFYYLNRIGEKNLGELTSFYEREYLKYSKTHDAISRVSQILTDTNIEHAVIKTIRPYKSTTVDIDVIIFGVESEYKKAILTLLSAEYGMLGQGPQSTTLQDPRINIKVDIYKEVAVSHIVYLDKRKLANFSVTKKLPNGESVKILTPEADLATVIAHSIIKEHMYTLSEYFTFVGYLTQIDLNKFIQFLIESNITVPTQTHATITALLHNEAFGMVPKPLQDILDYLGEATLEATLVMNGFKMPHKYHPLTVGRSMLEIAKGEKSRKSMARQLLRMLKPSFTKEFTKLFLDHLTRETY